MNTYPNAMNLPAREVTKAGQVFWPGVAYSLFPAGCMCDRSGSCEWCYTYYYGPEEDE